jgi:hypothetical protein
MKISVHALYQKKSDLEKFPPRLSTRRRVPVRYLSELYTVLYTCYPRQELRSLIYNTPALE